MPPINVHFLKNYWRRWGFIYSWLRAKITLLPSSLQTNHHHAITQFKWQKCPSTSKKQVITFGIRNNLIRARTLSYLANNKQLNNVRLLLLSIAYVMYLGLVYMSWSQVKLKLTLELEILRNQLKVELNNLRHGTKIMG